MLVKHTGSATEEYLYGLIVQLSSVSHMTSEQLNVFFICLKRDYRQKNLPSLDTKRVLAQRHQTVIDCKESDSKYEIS